MTFLAADFNWAWALTAAVSASLLAFPALRARGGGAAVSPALATQLMNREDAVVVDVREPDEWKAGHILNARHIPLAELEKRLGDLAKFKAKPVIVSCRSGSRAASASRILRKNGFEKVYTLEGGMQAWEQAGLPTSKK
ncbi:MAG: rhodanese-like domain-containing protein [Rhodocyclaceae bacterium]|nr:rhodanese-like domain-containing protein [Rhodocyclaceae bacterium]